MINILPDKLTKSQCHALSVLFIEYSKIEENPEIQILGFAYDGDVNLNEVYLTLTNNIEIIVRGSKTNEGHGTISFKEMLDDNHFITYQEAKKYIEDK